MTLAGQHTAVRPRVGGWGRRATGQAGSETTPSPRCRRHGAARSPRTAPRGARSPSGRGGPIPRGLGHADGDGRIGRSGALGVRGACRWSVEDPRSVGEAAWEKLTISPVCQDTRGAVDPTTWTSLGHEWTSGRQAGPTAGITIRRRPVLAWSERAGRPGSWRSFYSLRSLLAISMTVFPACSGRERLPQRRAWDGVGVLLLCRAGRSARAGGPGRPVSGSVLTPPWRPVGGATGWRNARLKVTTRCASAAGGGKGEWSSFAADSEGDARRRGARRKDGVPVFVHAGSCGRVAGAAPTDVVAVEMERDRERMARRAGKMQVLGLHACRRGT